VRLFFVPFFCVLFIFQYHSKTRLQHREFRLRIKLGKNKNSHL
jgi:hypothetical protein